MPKVSKATASSHQPIPGVLDAYSHELDGWTVSMETHPIDLDAAFLFKGAPNDQCQAPHMGFVLKGKYGMRTADGVEEVYEAGDAFFVGPGHTPITFAGCEIVYFTRTEEANRELPVAAANLMKYMQEQGMEVPAAPQPLSLIHISEPTRLLSISYAVFCLKKKKKKTPVQTQHTYT